MKLWNYSKYHHHYHHPRHFPIWHWFFFLLSFRSLGETSRERFFFFFSSCAVDTWKCLVHSLICGVSAVYHQAADLSFISTNMIFKKTVLAIWEREEKRIRITKLLNHRNVSTDLSLWKEKYHIIPRGFVESLFCRFTILGRRSGGDKEYSESQERTLQNYSVMYVTRAGQVSEWPVLHPSSFFAYKDLNLATFLHLHCRSPPALELPQ